MRKINLFNYDAKPVAPPKKIVYAGLNIHQKINYRSNFGSGMHHIPYLSHYYYFTKPLFKPVTDHLTRKYWTEYRWNAGGENRLDQYLKSKNKTLFS